TGSLKQVASSDHERDRRDDRPSRSGFLWVVGSSHRGEEEIILNAFQSLKASFRDLRLVLAPRHPQRFSEVEKLLILRGVSFEKKSQMNGGVTFHKDLLLLDTIGDLENFYAIGDVAFVGGSLVDAGGHNLLEPARWHKPLLFGPYTSNVTPVANALKQQGGGFEVHCAEDLVRELTVLLEEPCKRKIAGENAYQIAVSDRSALEPSLAIVARYVAAVNS
ncbi:MAG: 3-deoxy-D-manno-octulosonic acid transferase, partial [Candidatus Angelobacter sp.]